MNESRLTTACFLVESFLCHELALKITPVLLF